MNAQFLNDWIVPISSTITLITVAVSSCIAVYNYQLNKQAEIRLKESGKAEIDIKLLGLMTGLVQKANGRSGYEVSQEIIKKILESKSSIDEKWFEHEDPYVLNSILSKASVITHPVGSSEQRFSMIAIGELGMQHEFLKNICIVTIKDFRQMEALRPLCDDILSKLKNSTIRN